MNAKTLAGIAQQLRREAITMLHQAQSGHPGSTLSSMDVLVALFHDQLLKHFPDQPNSEQRDYFIFSNGHACPALYTVLADRGYFPKSQLAKLRQLGAAAQGHPHRGALPGVEISSGSLGQGLSVGIGLAQGLRLKKKNNHVFVMMSDGEQEEGSTWEAVMYAPKIKPLNLVAIIDKNGMQIDGATKQVMPALDPLPAKYRAFGWHVQEINGHSFPAITTAIRQAIKVKAPAVIISNTVRGRGVSFMANSEHWHAGAITKEQYEQAMKELT